MTNTTSAGLVLAGRSLLLNTWSRFFTVTVPMYQQDGESTALHPAYGWPIWMTDRPLFQILSIDAHDLLALAEDAGATPSEMDAALDFGNRLTAELLDPLVRQGFLDRLGRNGKSATMPQARLLT